MFTLANQCSIEDKCFNSIECKNEFKKLSQFPCHSTFGQITDDFPDLETLYVCVIDVHQSRRLSKAKSSEVKLLPLQGTK